MLLRFEAGQKFISKTQPTNVAEVVQVMDDGHKAWFVVRDENDNDVQRGEVNIQQAWDYWILKQ